MERLKLFALFLLCQVAHVISSIWLLCAIIAGSARAPRIILAYDRVGNAATGGSDKELMTERAHRGCQEGNRWWCALCDLLDIVDEHHCKKSAKVSDEIHPLQ